MSLHILSLSLLDYVLIRPKQKKKHQIGKRKGREISTLCHTCFSFLHQKFPDLQDHSLGECSSSSSIFEMSEKFSIFLASSGSFTVNDNIHRFFFFRCLVVANFEFAGQSLQKKNTHVGPFPWKQYCKILTKKERIRVQELTGFEI